MDDILKKNQLVGLDIGSHSIKLVELEHYKNRRFLKHFGIIGLPPEAIVEGSIREMEIVSSAIKNLYSNLKVKNKNIATSISGYSVIVKKMEVYKKEGVELQKTIWEDAEQYIPFDIKEVNLDFDILTDGNELKEEVAEEGEFEESAEEGEGRMEVMLVAAKKDIVDDYVNLLEISGLNLEILDLDQFALRNAFELSAHEAASEGCVALINLGAEELGFNAIKEGMSIFTINSSFGADQITKAIMSEFDVSFEKAERIKLGGIRVGKKKGTLREIFTAVVAEWIQEIKRALDFFSSTYPEDTIKNILLTGGSCRILGFQKYLELKAGISVTELNPFSNIIINEKNFDMQYLKYLAPQAAVAVGLALRSIGDK